MASTSDLLSLITEVLFRFTDAYGNDPLGGQRGRSPLSHTNPYDPALNNVQNFARTFTITGSSLLFAIGTLLQVSPSARTCHLSTYGSRGRDPRR